MIKKDASLVQVPTTLLSPLDKYSSSLLISALLFSSGSQQAPPCRTTEVAVMLLRGSSAPTEWAWRWGHFSLIKSFPSRCLCKVFPHPHPHLLKTWHTISSWISSHFLKTILNLFPFYKPIYGFIYLIWWTCFKLDNRNPRWSRRDVGCTSGISSLTPSWGPPDCPIPWMLAPRSIPLFGWWGWPHMDTKT